MTPEQKVTKEVIGYLDTLKEAHRPIWWVKLHGHAMQQRGLPDLMVVLNGQAIFMELKKPGGKATPLQTHTFNKLRLAGARAGVVTSVDDARRLVELNF